MLFFAAHTLLFRYCIDLMAKSGAREQILCALETQCIEKVVVLALGSIFDCDINQTIWEHELGLILAIFHLGKASQCFLIQRYRQLTRKCENSEATRTAQQDSQPQTHLPGPDILHRRRPSPDRSGRRSGPES